MEAIELPPDLVDALRSVHWKVATYPEHLPPLPVEDLECVQCAGRSTEWIGIARKDWAVLKVSAPAGSEGDDGLPTRCGATRPTQLQPGDRVEFICRTRASITASPLDEDDAEMLEDLSVGDPLPTDIAVKCLSLSGKPSGDTCEDKILAGSKLLGRVADRYTFEYEPLQRLRRNFGAVDEPYDATAFDLYRFGDCLPDGCMLAPHSDDGIQTLDLYHQHELHVLAVVAFNDVRRSGIRSHVSLSTVASGASKNEVLNHEKKWKLLWNPLGQVIMPGDLCIVSGAQRQLAMEATDIFCGHAIVPTNVMPRAATPSSCPILDWMVALVFPNPTSSKCTCKTITEEDAKSIFKRSFKPVVAGQNRAEYLRQRWHRFRNAFRELPEHSTTQTKSFLGLSLGRSPSCLGGKPFSCPGKPPRLPHIPCSDRHTRVCYRLAQPRCFLELLQQTIIDELVEDCGLTVEPCFSDDHEKIIILITCSKETLLREAELQRFTAELDLQAVDPESLEPCSSDFEPLLHHYLGSLPDESGPEALALLEKYQEVVEAIELEWADASEEFRARFAHARTFWLAGGMHASSMYFDEREPRRGLRFLSHLRRTRPRRSNRRAAFMEYMSLRAQLGLGPHSRLLMHEASARVKMLRCHGLTKLLRLWSPMVETWSCILRNHWDRFAGGMKHGRAMAFCSKRPGMDWTAFRTFEAKTLNTREGTVQVPFCSKDRLLLLMGILHRGLFLEELLQEGTTEDLVALDSSEKGDALGRIWQVPQDATVLRKAVWFARGLLEPPPTDEINHYYSSRIGFYFELTKFLIAKLFPLGLLGVVLQLFRMFSPNTHLGKLGVVHGFSASDTINFIFAVVTPFWVIVVLSLWRRRQAWLVTHWGRSAQASYRIRPAFWGMHRRSPTAVGEFEITFPTFYRDGIVGRFPRQVLSCMALLLLIAVEFVCAIPITVLRRDLHSHMFSLALPLMMQIFGSVGYEVARRLTQWENYPTSRAFIGNLAFKISIFEFLNRYGILFYIAFLKAFWEGCIVHSNQFREACAIGQNDCEMCQEELQEYVVLVLVSSVALSSTQLALPLVWNKSFRQNVELALAYLRGVKQEKAEAPADLDLSARMASTVKQMAERPEFGDAEVDGSFDDYLQVFVLFGYAALFSVAFPLAPLVVAFAMMVELRVDGVKIYNLLRRPFPIPANGLESWMHIFYGLVVCAVVANAGLAVWTFRLLGGEDDTGRWIRFLVVMICTTVLMSITQLAPCFTMDESSLPMQRRTNYIVDNLMDSQSGEGAMGSSRRSVGTVNRSFVYKDGSFDDADSVNSHCSDYLEDNDLNSVISHEDVMVKLDSLDSADCKPKSVQAPSQARPSVRFSSRCTVRRPSRSASRRPAPSFLHPHLEFRLMPCFGAALRCFFQRRPAKKRCDPPDT